MPTVPDIEGYSELIWVARGGFGSVYRGRQDRHGRDVAIKVLDVDDLDRRARERFDRECRAMGSLSWHPNVVALLDSGVTEEGRPYLTMDFVEGGTFADRVVDAPLPWAEAVAVAVKVAGALDVAHGAGILHRDLKPENLLVGPYGEVLLGDFGIAALEGAGRTTAGNAAFTVDHVAPEVLQGQRPDERSDVYGLGSTLYTLVAGEPPFSVDAGTPIAAKLQQVIGRPAPRLTGVPDDLADVVSRALEKDPQRRPASAAELGRALQAVQAAHG
ncbi:MAG: serine/threonine protein kinase, partial [Acidimicrobiales bacterium]|nr:serine/threonine protein kinase [Acidimicrobiales bacterium]